MVRQQEAEKMTREVLSTSTSHPLSLQAPSLAGGRPHSSALIRVARLFACNAVHSIWIYRAVLHGRRLDGDT